MYSEDNSASLLDEIQGTPIEADHEQPRDFFEEAYAVWSQMVDYIRDNGLPILDNPGAEGQLLRYIENNISPEDEQETST